MATNSAELIYKAAIASYVNPVFEAKQQAEAAHMGATIGLDDNGRPLSPVQRIEKYFGLIDTAGRRKVTATELATAWIARVANPTDNDLQLIAREIDRFMKIADLDADGCVSLNEYLNYMLTLITEHDEGKRFEIHGLLAEKCATDPALMDNLLRWFLEHDVVGEGEISIDAFRAILERVKHKKRLQIHESVFSQRTVGYAQYVLLMLGRTPTKVSLIFYDISGRATKALSRLLFGKKIEGIWHTSILAFGYEWWFGGDCFQSRPFTTPFGPTPSRVVDLGETTRSLPELKDFVRSKMRPKFNYETYDVINNNCNNFTNDVSMFLLHTGIQKSVIALPTDLLSGGLAKLLRPFLNKWLGGFEGDDDEEGSKDVLDKIRKEKAGGAHAELAPGDIAMWKRSETELIYCEVLQVRKDGKILIKVFKNMKFKEKLIKDKTYVAKIPREELSEHESSINYLIALSILEANRGHTDKASMQHITMHLIDSLIAGEHSTKAPTVHKRMSMIAPGGLSDDDGGDGETIEPAPRNCCQSFWAKCRCSSN